MEEKERNKLALLGLIVGFILGSGLNYLLLLLQNWLSQFWSHLEPVEITLRNVIPLGVLMGLSMAAALRSGLFETYGD
jgi:ABC-type uncharacterized transport system permease subunit